MCLCAEFNSFPLSPSFPWSNAAEPLQWSLPAFALDLQFITTSVWTYVVQFCVVMIWIVLAIACWASWEFVIRRRPSYDHEKFTARKVGSVVWFFPWSTATVGFIPIFRSLISVYDCKKQDDGSFTWDRDPTVDISNGHYGLYVFALEAAALCS